ncbi:Ig domain-containing protein [Variovorax saccharolyticus]|uniref:Ig domain-containing protein n=1 Tax=Variovorax saccharolyticus TaxID=3053516 RepID=UPI00257845E1|nr:putative Ig domain-containing protein [Variovorax sp. J31P216]MDM0030340.1 putative Ig domain-containing protein [Variovorax sp. J31P216]
MILSTLSLATTNPPPLRAQLEISPFALVRTVVAPPGLYVGPLVYEAQGLPAGLRVAAETGVLSGRPEGPLDTEFTLVVRALLATPMLSGSSVVRVVARAELRLVGHSSWLTAQEGTPITPSRLASAAGGDEGGKLRFTVTPALPPGLTLDSESSVLSGTLAAGVESATRNYTLAVSDGRETAFAGFSLQTVARMGNAGSSLSPRPTEPPPLMLKSQDVEMRGRRILAASDAKRRPVVGQGQEPLSYRLQGELPRGLRYVDGQLAGWPEGTDRFIRVYRVDVTDATGQTRSISFKLTVDRDPKDGGSDELHASWDESNKVRLRTKGETVRSSLQWTMNGVVTKGTLNGALLSNVNTALNTTFTTNGVNVASQVNGVNLNLTCSLAAWSRHETRYTRSRTYNRKADTTHGTYRGRYRVAWTDPPPIDISFVHATDGLHKWSHALKDNMDRWGIQSSDALIPTDTVSDWIQLSQDDLSRAGSLELLQQFPEWTRSEHQILNLGNEIAWINAQIPGKTRAPGAAEKIKHMAWMRTEGRPLSDAEKHNAAVRIDVVHGARQTYTIVPDGYRAFTCGGRTGVHFGEERDIYLDALSFSTKDYRLLVEGPTAVQYHRADGTTKAARWLYEAGLSMHLASRATGEVASYCYPTCGEYSQFTLGGPKTGILADAHDIAMSGPGQRKLFAMDDRGARVVGATVRLSAVAAGGRPTTPAAGSESPTADSRQATARHSGSASPLSPQPQGQPHEFLSSDQEESSSAGRGALELPRASGPGMFDDQQTSPASTTSSGAAATSPGSTEEPASNVSLDKDLAFTHRQSVRIRGRTLLEIRSDVNMKPRGLNF